MGPFPPCRLHAKGALADAIVCAHLLQETRTSTLLDYGAPVGSDGPSSMAKLVGVPCGIATQLVLDGVVSAKGILAPYSMDIVKPIMEALEAEGITMVEKTL